MELAAVPHPMIIVSVGGINGKSEEGKFIEKEKKKMGRPTDDPKPVKLTVRVSRETEEILDAYCERNDRTRGEGIRDAINLLKDK